MTHMMETAQESLIQRHRSYAHALAADVIATLPRDIDREDIRAAAELGLVEAANAYDPSRGVHFQTFAYYRIRGAVYDCLRKIGWLPQSLYKKLQFERAANDYMEAEASLPQQTRVSCSTEEQYDSIRQTTGAIVSAYMLSIESLPAELPERRRSPEENAADAEHVSKLREALARLPERNRQVLMEYYFGDRSLEEIGRSMGLSRSWTCRLHAKSLDLLRELMADCLPMVHNARRSATSPVVCR
jgi:RNA polymerase sigma factor FliA